jgi:RNA polymerase sigma factor (sigma-70 family)
MPESDRQVLREVASNAVFATTHWSLVASAADVFTDEATIALERLCQAYWSPLYAYVRRCGKDAEAARDLTQGFFAQLIEKRRLSHADRERGRFRTFLLCAMQNFLRNEHDRAQAIKRGGGRDIISLDQQEAEERVLKAVAQNLTPETLFEKRWASRLIEVVMDRLRAEFFANGQNQLFDRLEPHLWGDVTSVPYTQLAEEMNMSLSALKSTAHRVRQRCRELLRAEIGQTVATVADIDAEIRYLMETFSR